MKMGKNTALSYYWQISRQLKILAVVLIGLLAGVATLSAPAEGKVRGANTKLEAQREGKGVWC
jgi:hypothetical protein